MNGKVTQWLIGVCIVLMAYSVYITTYIVTTKNLAERNKEDIKEFKQELKNVNKNVTNIAIKLGVIATN